MKQLLPGLTLAATFIVGCVVATAASDIAVPPARSADVQRWEYSCRQASSGITEMSNELGAEGWEMVASAGVGASQYDLTARMVWCFKRPL